MLTWAQTGKISGIIIDKNTQETLIGVNVSIDSSMLGATTDIDGKYEITDLTPGQYNFIISYIGYANKYIQNIIVRADEVTSLDIHLEVASNELAEV